MAIDPVTGAYKPDTTATTAAAVTATRGLGVGGVSKPQTGQVPSVSGRANELMQVDNPIMRQAKTAGIQVANRRGLGNSSMAAQASQAAALQTALPIASQEATMAADARERGLDRRMTQEGWNRDSAERAEDRGLQKQIANWNLAASERQGAASFTAQMEAAYATNYQSIMSNTALSAEDRSKFLTSIANLRDKQLNLVEQMYDIDLTW